MKRNIEINLDFALKDILPKFSIKQFDNANIKVNTFIDNEVFNPNGNTCKLYVGYEDECFMQTSNITVRDNFIEINLDRNVISKKGKALAELELTNSQGVSTSTSFIFTVEGKIGELATLPGQVEGFLDANKRVIEEFKNTIDEKFTMLSTSQQQDSEVIFAREDYKGNVFKSLKDRLDSSDKLISDATVRTIETDNSFECVTGTKSGYFDVLELNGRTYANLGDKKSGEFDFKMGYPSNGIDIKLSKSINTEFTLCLKANNSLDNFCKVALNCENKTTIYPNAVGIASGFNGLHCVKINPVKDGIYYHVDSVRLYTDNTNSGKLSFDNLIIIEGDHTQNPPSYFEGLASAGDGTDEIVVSSGDSCDTNLRQGGYVFALGQKVENGGVLANRVVVNANNLVVGNEITIKTPFNQVAFGEVDENDILLVDTGWLSGSVVNYKAINPKCKKFSVTFRKSDNSNLTIDECKNARISIKTDKKKLLYYDTETQSWKKPILREWDSIEKHSDGKYYYHVRSGQVALNGNEDWSIETSAVFLYTPRHDMYRCEDYTKSIICDKFNTTINKSYNLEGITGYGNLDSYVGQNWIYIKSDNFSSIDSIKQWLQANPVTVVYKLAQEKVYECTNIDLITYENETNYIVESGATTPRSTLKAISNISSVVNLLQKKVSLLESNLKWY